MQPLQQLVLPHQQRQLQHKQLTLQRQLLLQLPATIHLMTAT
jgi:hypothetical protein